MNDISEKANQRIEELNSRENSLVSELSNLKSIPDDVSSEKLKIQKLIDENKDLMKKSLNNFVKLNRMQMK